MLLLFLRDLRSKVFRRRKKRRGGRGRGAGWVGEGGGYGCMGALVTLKIMSFCTAQTRRHDRHVPLIGGSERDKMPPPPLPPAPPPFAISGQPAHPPAAATSTQMSNCDGRAVYRNTTYTRVGHQVWGAYESAVQFRSRHHVKEKRLREATRRAACSGQAAGSAPSWPRQHAQQPAQARDERGGGKKHTRQLVRAVPTTKKAPATLLA
jgi:hypothetical protein